MKLQRRIRVRSQWNRRTKGHRGRISGGLRDRFCRAPRPQDHGPRTLVLFSVRCAFSPRRHYLQRCPGRTMPGPVFVAILPSFSVLHMQQHLPKPRDRQARGSYVIALEPILRFTSILEDSLGRWNWMPCTSFLGSQHISLFEFIFWKRIPTWKLVFVFNFPVKLGSFAILNDGRSIFLGCPMHHFWPVFDIRLLMMIIITQTIR